MTILLLLVLLVVAAAAMVSMLVAVDNNHKLDKAAIKQEEIHKLVNSRLSKALAEIRILKERLEIPITEDEEGEEQSSGGAAVVPT